MVHKFYILRHGETFATKNNTGYGWRVFSASILDEGKVVIEREGEFLADISFDICLSSPVKRCRQTAAIISKHIDTEILFDKRLSEFWLETFEHFRKRIWSVISELDAHDQYKTVLIITHGAGIAALTHMLEKGTFLIPHMTDYPKPGIMTVIERGNVARLIDFNEQKEIID